jgi:hypothetical protein
MSGKDRNKNFITLTDLKNLEYKIDNLDERMADKVSDELEQVQPYFLIRLFTYMARVNEHEFAEILKAYFLTWLFFRTKKALHVHKVTKEKFQVVLDRQIAMVNYVGGESNPEERKRIYESDLDNIKSKLFFNAIISRFKSNPVLQKIDTHKRGLIMIDIKTFIECFDAIDAA